MYLGHNVISEIVSLFVLVVAFVLKVAQLEDKHEHDKDIFRGG
jgi:hypothetical protein